MTVHRPLVAMLCLCCAANVPAQAQDDRSLHGSDPLTTEKALNTTAVGQTKPPSRDASPTAVKAIDRPTPRQAADDAIASTICIGCAPEPATTGALPPAGGTDAGPAKRDVRLDELRALAPPPQQPDLNTVDLASAHRERARSVEEKTDGLWQSWLVSVCEGCGDQKPARSLRYEEWPDRGAPLTTGSFRRGASDRTSAPSRGIRTAHASAGSLGADLSPENVDSIRRRPAR